MRITDLAYVNLDIKDRLDDLENRSRRNNLRIVELPESYVKQILLNITQMEISKALGLPQQCMAERAHRLGLPQSNRPPPRPVIVKYL